ncbi:cobalt-precorrin-5B (C(1))-methyltransferase CbiD [Peptostreptococcus sp. D1]|uniref:cobalt-precorrin-5B (C(1))-methyltransferase CbiD n=1 Tax=Peptostreptococcus sp. D1 TaxID=72304 RepID=UPI0008EDDA1A|nr:cobalt-precorrin-5B (C(1))-methyltransferase CbiD [Peptostreptococcus sp. D1]SFE33081.1 cobalt-precorrin 5B C1-methyltransferase [Peptostreptococcus sp. D1]
MDSFVYIDGKKYRRGFTTGSCAAASTKASLIKLIAGEDIKRVNIDTPKGISIEIPVVGQTKENESVISYVIKDGGDDVDATNKMEIFSKVELITIDELPMIRSEKLLEGVEITSGVGIGIVTKRGLSVDVGRPAINPIPLRMICDEIENVFDDFGIDRMDFLGDKILLVTIFAPRGEDIAKETFNSNLGIEGGISIIGTSGIVEPMSEEAWKKALTLELSMKRVDGEKIVLVPGNIGLSTMVEIFGFDENRIVKMSNFIGYMLMECKRLGFKDIVIGGHIGKLIKMSAGIMNTHSRFADARNEIMVSNLALMGGELDFLSRINECVTTDAMIPIIEAYGYEKVFEIIAEKSVSRAKRFIRAHDENIEIEVWLFSMDGKLLAKK